MEIEHQLLRDEELANYLRERVPMFFDFGGKAASYTWNPLDLARELKWWLAGGFRVHGQSYPPQSE